MPNAHYNPKFLADAEVAFLKLRIESGNSYQTYKTLQEVCRLFRLGYRLRPTHLIAIEQSIVGLLYTHGPDEKVRRWALNALAQLGRESTCLEAILHILAVAVDQIEVAAAAIAAIYRLSKRATEILAKHGDFSPQMAALAALQHVDAAKLDLSALPIDVETADPETLKLALLVVGLDRAPINLLNPRHTNAEMVKALGGHHDDVVSQYTVWAITENPSLGLEDLGIDIRLIEQLPPNVRAWLFQLIAMNPTDATSHIEYIQLGMSDREPEARMGLAMGLRDTFFDGLDALALDWFTHESEPEVNHLVLDHLVPGITIG